MIPFYKRFIDRFPTVQTLAETDCDEVLRYWEGLGYYRRARQMHAAARVITSEYNGQFPTEIDQVRALPGIGRYTAGAVLSIALEQRHPILEANTIRVFSRLMMLRGDPACSENRRQMWEFSKLLLPRRRVGDFNQALMELGSTVCTSRDPTCERCPIARICPARAHGVQAQFPEPTPKAKTIAVHEAAIVLRCRRKILIRHCQPGERWAGLWDFLRFELSSTKMPLAETQIIEQVAKSTGLTITRLQYLTTFKHAVTRYRITLTCHEAFCTSSQSTVPPLCWVTQDQLQMRPFSTTGRKICELLNGG